MTDTIMINYSERLETTNLEVITKRPVSKHLEERMVIGIFANIVEI